MASVNVCVWFDTFHRRQVVKERVVCHQRNYVSAADKMDLTVLIR